MKINNKNTILITGGASGIGYEFAKQLRDTNTVIIVGRNKEKLEKVKKELKNMDQRLYELEEKMTSIDTKLSQVVDAILGNPLTKSGGFIKDIEIMKEKIQEVENKIQAQEEFKKKITWTFAIVVTVALILEYFVNIYSSIT